MNRREFLKATAAAGGALAAISALPVHGRAACASGPHCSSRWGQDRRPAASGSGFGGCHRSSVERSGSGLVAVVKVTISDGSHAGRSIIRSGRSRDLPGQRRKAIWITRSHVLKTQLDPKSLPEGTEPGVVDEAAVGDKAGEIEDIVADIAGAGHVPA